MLRRLPRAGRLPVLLAVLAALLFSCAAPTGSSGRETSDRHSLEEGVPARVTFIEYRGPLRMNLVNEAHTDPVRLYSEKRATANTKVLSNEVMEAMLEHFEAQGFQRYAQSGFAPARPAQGDLQGIEVETGGETVFLVNGAATSAPARDAFRECRTAFLQIQQLTKQAQVVNQGDVREIFRTPASKN